MFGEGGNSRGVSGTTFIYEMSGLYFFCAITTLMGDQHAIEGR